MPFISPFAPVRPILLKPTVSRRTLVSAKNAVPGGTPTLTTGAFTPNANTLLAVFAHGNGDQASGPSTTYTTGWTITGGSLTWTQRQLQGGTFTTNTFSGFMSVWTAPVNGPAGAASMTVTVAHPTVTAGFRSQSTVVLELTGVNIASPVGGVALGPTSQGQAAASLTMLPGPGRNSACYGYRVIAPTGSEDMSATPGPLWTEIYDDFDGTSGSGTAGMQIQERIGITSPVCDWLDLSVVAITIDISATAVIEFVAGG